MQLHRLALLNFRQHRATEIEFGPGLTGIIGPNGAGKTTLLEAIGWALYGLDATRGTRDSLRWRRAAPRGEVRVELEFGLGPHEYRVVRTLFSAELYLDGGLAPVATSLREVTARITRVLGMSRVEFANTYFTGQRDLAAMRDLGPAERRRFLNRLLGYERLQSAQRLVRDRRAAMDSELRGLELGAADPEALAAVRVERAVETAAAEARLAECELALADAQGASEAHLPVFRELREFRERHQSLAGERRLLEERLRQAVDLVTGLGGRFAEAEAARSELDGLRQDVEAFSLERQALEVLETLARDGERRARLEERLAESHRQAADLLPQLQRAREEAARALAIAERLERTRAEREAADREVQERHAAYVRERADADATRRSLLEQFRDLETHMARIEAAGPDGACPTCGRPLGAEFASVRDLLAQQLEDVRQNGQYYRAKLQQLQEEPAELRAAREQAEGLALSVEADFQELAAAKRAADEAIDLEKQQQHLDERQRQLAEEMAVLRGGYDREQHETVRRRVQELEPAVRRAERLAADAERAPVLAAELAEAERRRGELVDALAAIQRALDGLQYDEQAVLTAEREMQRLERAWQAADRDVAVARAELTAVRERLAEAERREQEATARARRAAELHGAVRLHGELDRALGELSADLNREMGPEIAAIAGEFLGSLTEGQYDEIVLDDAFNATVLEDGEAQPVLSGGEEDLRDLVLRLAVSQMIAERAGQPLALLVLDEIFGSLDDARRTSVVQLLRRLGGRFPQVLLITHIESVREALDRVLRVRYDEASQAAIVTEEPAWSSPAGGADAHVAA